MKSHSRSVLLQFVLFFVCIFLLTGIFFYPFAQNSNKDKLLDKKKKIEEEIEYYKKLLKETKKTKELSLNQIVMLKNQIESRETLIGEINNEVLQLEEQIEENNGEIKRSSEQMDLLKEEYASMIFHAYKNRHSWSRLMFIFASDDFNQAYERLMYFRQYDEFRKRQLALIISTRDKINMKNKELISQKNNKTELIETSEQEKIRLAIEKEEQSLAVKTLKKKEADLKKKLKNKEEEARKLQKKIEAVIAEEINKSAKKSNKTVSGSTTMKNVLTPEEKLVSDNFAGNRGRLPWPVEKGVISGTFGEHPHPVLDGIMVKNNGIDIATTPGTNARAVFGGIVSSIISINAGNKAIIIRHGEYFTVYSNLESVNVSKGQNVTAKQVLGEIYSNPDEGKTELHFEIWQGKVLCNPSDWIVRR